MTRSRAATVALWLGVCLLAASACSREPSTPEEKRQHGLDLVRRMSDVVAKAPAFTVSTSDTRTVTRRGQPVTVRTMRTFGLRRPDRAAFTVSGDRVDVKGYYADGKLTLVSAPEKVWARVRAERTLDDTLDRLAERFEIQMPMADFLYSTPFDALIGKESSGGYVGRETIDGVECAHVSFSDAAAEWHLWLPVSGDPLPKKYRLTDKGGRTQATAEVVFERWDLTAQPDAASFTASVPGGFERIDMTSRDSPSQTTPAGAR
jgi:hypothetical protein